MRNLDNVSDKELYLMFMDSQMRSTDCEAGLSCNDCNDFDCEDRKNIN